MNKMMNKFLQPKVTFRNRKLWENLYGEESHPPSEGNHFVPMKYLNFHVSQGFRVFRLNARKSGLTRFNKI